MKCVSVIMTNGMENLLARMNIFELEKSQHLREKLSEVCASRLMMNQS